MAEGAETFSELARLRSIADPERDARIEAYRDQERRKAARALDRYIEGLVDAPKIWNEAASVAGERFVQAVGDYVLSRLSAPNVVTGDDGTRYVMSPDAHKSHYGVSCAACGSTDPAVKNWAGGYPCDDPGRFHQSAREHRGVRCTCERRNDSYLPEAHEPTCAWALSVRFPVKGAELAPDGRKICICGQADGLHVGEVCPVCGSTRRTDEVSGE